MRTALPPDFSPMSRRPLVVLRQSDHGVSSVESRLAAQFCMVTDARGVAVPLSGLRERVRELAAGALPVGSVEFLREAMRLAGVVEPHNLSYPEVLQPFFHRELARVGAGDVLQCRMGLRFVKPVATKAFTGVVLDASRSFSVQSEDACEAVSVLSRMPADEKVWVSEVVSWLSEWRFYVLEGRIVGEGRYDAGPDDAPRPLTCLVKRMIESMSGWSECPVAYALDVGVLPGGATALVECNDAWALGFYRGTLSRDDYIGMLFARWSQLRVLAA